MIKILFICHGNICRSTMAQSVMTELTARAGYSAQLEINSAATSREEIGNTPHYGTVNKLRVSCIIKIPIIAEGSPQSCRGNFPIIADLCLVFP